MNEERTLELQKVVIVDGEEYKLTQFMPSRAFKLGARIVKLIGEPLATMGTSGGDGDKAVEALPLAVKALLTNLHEDEVWTLIQSLMACVSQNNQLLNIERHFQGRMGSLCTLVKEVVEYQFADFSRAIGKEIARVGGNQKVVK